MDGQAHAHVQVDVPARKASWGADLAGGLQWAFVLLAVMLLGAFHFSSDHQDVVAEITRVFLSIVLEALPFIILGSLVGGFIESFVSSDRITRALSGRGLTAALLAGGLGLVFPVCECAIVPVVRRLMRKGVPLSAAVAFLLAGPIVNPIVAASTFVAYRFDWRVTGLRVGLGYVIAVSIGLLIGGLFRRRPGRVEQDDHPSACACGCGHSHHRNAVSVRQRAASALRHAADDFVDIGRYLVIGAFIAGCVRGGIDQQSLLSLAGNTALSIPLMMGLAFVLTLCSEADAFVAASLGTSVPMSAQLAFLLLGPMLDIKLVLMFLGLFRKRLIAVLAAAIVLAVAAAAFLYQASAY